MKLMKYGSLFPNHSQQPSSQQAVYIPQFIERYRQVLKPGGIIHLKTDNDMFYRIYLSYQRCRSYFIVQQFRSMQLLMTPR
ncbi:MAG: hypothetical protein U0Z17_10250 [Bacteroidales bacterium]